MWCVILWWVKLLLPMKRVVGKYYMAEKYNMVSPSDDLSYFAAPTHLDEGTALLALPFHVDMNCYSSLWEEGFTHMKALSYYALGTLFTEIAQPKPAQELSLVFTDNSHIQSLNYEHRGKDRPTNVLSFPTQDFIPHFGDIVLGFETINREAKERGIYFIDHVTHLIMHGFLHLNGYTHDHKKEAELMESLEISALAKLYIDNPYEIPEQ